VAGAVRGRVGGQWGTGILAEDSWGVGGAEGLKTSQFPNHLYSQLLPLYLVAFIAMNAYHLHPPSLPLTPPQKKWVDDC